MTFEIDIDGKVAVVALEPLDSPGEAGGRFRVRVHPETAPGAHAGVETTAIIVDARPTELGLSLRYEDDGRIVDVALAHRPHGECLIQLRRASLTAVVDGRRFRRDTLSDAGNAAEQRITSPMPGRVVRVLVKPGDAVVPRQGIVVVEAMKMENELVAAAAGLVTEIAVSEGASVEAGRLLVRIEVLTPDARHHPPD